MGVVAARFAGEQRRRRRLLLLRLRLGHEGLVVVLAGAVEEQRGRGERGADLGRRKWARFEFDCGHEMAGFFLLYNFWGRYKEKKVI